MEQEHRITYKAGITRTPSDFLCQDGELAECINLATANEELKPVVQPVYKITFGLPTGEQDWPTDAARKAVYIHKHNNTDRYILIYCMSPGHSPWYLYWTTNGYDIYALFDEEGHKMGFDSDDIKVTSIGKTLIVSEERGLKYFLWKENEYKSLGQIPKQDVRFYLQDDTHDMYGYKVNNSISIEHIDWDEAGYNYYTVSPRSREDWNDAIIGAYSKNKRAVANKKGFCLPFLARTALRLYDGSYIYVSQPVMLFPSINENTLAQSIQRGGNLVLMTLYKKLYYDNRSFYNLDMAGVDPISFYEDWTDIVKDIVIFITAGIEIHDLTVDQDFTFALDEPLPPSQNLDGIFDKGSDMQYYNKSIPSFRVLAVSDDVATSMTSASVFYKLCSVGLFERSAGTSSLPVADKIERHLLENLVTQEMLEYDDYFSRSAMVPQTIYSYNSRLNLANVSRSMFDGYDYFLPYYKSSVVPYLKKPIKIYVTIQTDDGERIVIHEGESQYMQNIYFFYPDSRAKHVMIFRWDNIGENYYCVLNEDLKEHDRLNGAYYFKGMPDGSETEPIMYLDEPQVRNEPEILSNYIVTSEVNNPWVFKAEGYNKVGTGKIIGMSTITQALSQGQFGQYPLLVFSESGIWAMSVDNTGLYQSIHPMSRDVCLNPNSILQTDGTVFFVSKKGLMVIVGNEVRCVSELMNGRAFNTATLSPLAIGTDWAGIVSACQGETTFLEYIRDEATFMSYDYIDSRIIITKPGAGFSFAYNIADGTISKVILPAAMTGAVNNYPDYLLQGTVTVEGTTQNRLYSYYEKPREENVAERQLGFVLTRPMKLAGPVSQASLRQLMNVGTWRKKDAQGNELSCVKTEVYLSEDMQTWFPDISRHGAAARYYRLALFIKMLPTERLSGTILTEQERRSHNMR